MLTLLLLLFIDLTLCYSFCSDAVVAALVLVAVSALDIDVMCVLPLP